MLLRVITPMALLAFQTTYLEMKKRGIVGRRITPKSAPFVGG
jgi:hypothetical protein